MKVYVGNLPFSMSEEQLRSLFGQFGEVVSVNVITDRETGRPRGFAFIEMTDEESGLKAIAELEDPRHDALGPWADWFGFSALWLDHPDTSAHTGVHVNEPFCFQGLQMIGHGRCRRNVERVTDLAQRGRIALLRHI